MKQRRNFSRNLSGAEILKFRAANGDKILRTRFKFRYKISLRGSVKFRETNAVVYAAKFTGARERT